MIQPGFELNVNVFPVNGRSFYFLHNVDQTHDT